MSTINLGNVKDLEVDLAKRDKILGDMEAQLYSKRFLLLQKREALKNAMKQNRFLEEDTRNIHFLVYQTSGSRRATQRTSRLLYLAICKADIPSCGKIHACEKTVQLKEP